MLWQALVLEECLWRKEEGKEQEESQGHQEGKEQQQSQEAQKPQELGKEQEAQGQRQEVIQVGSQDPTAREREEERGGPKTRLGKEGQQETLEVEGLPTLGRTWCS